MLLQQSEAIVHESPGCPVPPPGAQHTLSMTSQFCEQHSELAMHCIETATHAASLAASLAIASPRDELSVAESSPVGPSVGITAPSPGGGCVSGADMSGMFASSEFAASPPPAESRAAALSVAAASPWPTAPEPAPHAARGDTTVRTRRSSGLRMAKAYQARSR